LVVGWYFAAASRLIARHAELFQQLFFDDYQALLALLLDACNHINRDVRYKAYASVESVVQQVGSIFGQA
jgi:hypothetical protein